MPRPMAMDPQRLIKKAERADMRGQIAQLREALEAANKENARLIQRAEKERERRAEALRKKRLLGVDKACKQANTITKLLRDVKKKDDLITGLRRELELRSASDRFIAREWAKLHPGVALPRHRKDHTLGVAEAWLALAGPQTLTRKDDE